MKKSLKIVVSAVLLIMLGAIVLVSINKKNKESECIFLEDTVVVKSHLEIDERGRQKTNFIMDFLYTGKVPEIELVSLNGENLENTIYSTETIIEDYAKDYEYRNYKVGSQFNSIEFATLNDNDIAKIKSVVYKVDGKEVEVILTEPLEYIFYINSEERITTGGYTLGASGMPTMQYYSYNANTDITITDFSFDDYIAIMDMNITIDDKTVYNTEDIDKSNTNIKEAFPIDLKKGSKIKIEVTCMDNNLKKECKNLYTDSVLTYKCGDETYECYVPVTIIEINGREDLDEIVDFGLEKMK